MLQTPPLSSVLLAEHSPILCPPLLPGLLCPDRAVRFAISASALFPLPCLSSLSSLLILAAFPSSALLAVQQLLPTRPAGPSDATRGPIRRDPRAHPTRPAGPSDATRGPILRDPQAHPTRPAGPSYATRGPIRRDPQAHRPADPSAGMYNSSLPLFFPSSALEHNY